MLGCNAEGSFITEMVMEALPVRDDAMQEDSSFIIDDHRFFRPNKWY
jgi:hypothetical protein